MFIVKKKVGKNEYFYLRESRREGKKVRAKTVAYLGKTRKEAEGRMKEFLKEKEDKNIMEKEKREIKEETKTEQKPESKKREIMERKKITIDELAVFCKRKGFVYPSSEIYGGVAGFWDFGPLGVEMKNNLKQNWWNYFVRNRDDIVGIDGAIITNPKVWEASGHVTNFVDVAVICKKCGYKTKLERSEVGKVKCEKCKGDYVSKGEFLNMFATNVGPIKEDSIKAFLRPETAQLIFANFKFVHDNARLKLPFGIAQIGKAFRNEVAPRDFLF